MDHRVEKAIFDAIFSLDRDEIRLETSKEFVKAEAAALRRAQGLSFGRRILERPVVGPEGRADDRREGAVPDAVWMKGSF